jgi:nicotinamide phosphoribosyltransferase
MKATHVVVDGEPRDIYKTPVTDDGTKNSATGLLRVDEVDGTFVLKERCTPEEEAGGALQTVFKNGIITKFPTLSEIRSRLWGENF